MTTTLKAVEDSMAVIAALHELIEALDKRIPNVDRVGETEIRAQAAELRERAVQRIEELTGTGTQH